MVWMRTAGLPNFRKLYGHASGTLTAGNWTITIVDRTSGAPPASMANALTPHTHPASAWRPVDARGHTEFPVTSFSGTKSVVLSTTSWLGGKNPFLGIAYMVVGSICLALFLGFLIRHLVKPRFARACSSSVRASGVWPGRGPDAHARLHAGGNRGGARSAGNWATSRCCRGTASSRVGRALGLYWAPLPPNATGARPLCWRTAAATCPRPGAGTWGARVDGAPKSRVPSILSVCEISCATVTGPGRPACEPPPRSLSVSVVSCLLRWPGSQGCT